MKLLYLLAFTLILSACVNAPHIAETNAELLVQGTWAEYVQDSEIKVYATYLPDGRYHSFGYFLPDFKKYFFADGYWRIEGDSSCIYITYLSTDDFAPGDVLCNRIVSLSEQEFVFDSGGVDVKMVKVSGVKL
ncbi:hypothetical protein ACJJIG_04405 [Microbulbifer sp. SSSA007]|uniref:hypothetical protein n=1 Tax=Microbulbifer sp. SSSA007 TaxID=3243379 RepID=UPI00403A10C1